MGSIMDRLHRLGEKYFPYTVDVYMREEDAYGPHCSVHLHRVLYGGQTFPLLPVFPAP